MEVIKELEFINKIEGDFPFDNYLQSIKLIDEAITISSNSVFAIIEEICKNTDVESATRESLISLLKYIDKKFEHPLRKLILETAQSIIFNEQISIEQTLVNMDLVRQHTRQYAALSILYFSAKDVNMQLKKHWDKIITEWNQAYLLFEESD